MTDLTVIVVNWNTRDLLQNCLRSVYQHTNGISYEIIVVDNASSDGSPDMVAREFPQAQLIRNRDNLGFSRANNQALRLATGRYLLLLNSDTTLQENAFQKMLIFMDAQPDAGIAGARLLNSDGSRQDSCDVFPRRPFSMLFDKIRDRFVPPEQGGWKERMRNYDFHGNFLVDYVIGAVLVIRRETFEQVGMLDEQFFMYAEDIDYCYRSAQAGWKNYYLGSAAVYHHNRGSSEKTPEQTLRLRKMRDQSLQQFYRKHYGPFNSLLLGLITRLKHTTP